MLRRLFTVTAFLSLLLCIAAVALGTRSFRTADGFCLFSGRALPKGVDSRYLFSARGTLGYRVRSSELREVPSDPSASLDGEMSPRGPVFSHCSARRPSRWFHSAEPASMFAPAAMSGEAAEPGNIDVRAVGFALRQVDTHEPFTPERFPQHVRHYVDEIVGIPHWLIALACAITPIAWLRGADRRRGHTRGLCRKCGYDLRATPQRCPECGTPVAGATEVVA